MILAASSELFNKLFSEAADHKVITKLTIPKIIEPLGYKPPAPVPKAEVKPPAEGAKPAEEKKPEEKKPDDKAADAKKPGEPKPDVALPLTDPVEIVLKYIYNNQVPYNPW